MKMPELTKVSYFIMGALFVYGIFYLLDMAETLQKDIEINAYQRGFAACLTDLATKNA